MSAYTTRVRNPIVATLSNHIDSYPTPINLSYLWSFGSLSGLALIIQIVTGVCLARHYAPEVHLAFASVEHIRRDVRGGVALRYIHANGASRFFILVYTHRFRGLYYASYAQPRSNLWYSGVVIFVLRRATGFRGYVLPWGQRSFWGATVITNLFSAIPGVGTSIVQLLWGGFSVDNPTLNRFFSLHYLLPFGIAGAALLHLVLLHQHGSNNPLGLPSATDRIPFYPYFYVKDLFSFLLFVLLFSFFVVYAPNRLGHPDNYIEANPLVTPAHIVPEWYFLPFYAVLRTIPDKLGGVVLRGLAIAILAFLPLLDTSSIRSTFFKPLHALLFWTFFCDSFGLGWIGQEVVETPFLERANFVTLTYFAYFLPLLPLLGILERSRVRRALALRGILLFFIASASLRFLFFLMSFLPPLSTPIVSRRGLTPILVRGIIPLFRLAVSLFVSPSGSFSRFLHRVGGALLFFAVFRGTHSFLLRGVSFDSVSLVAAQGDPLFPRLFLLFGSATLAILLFGLADRFLLSRRVERELPLLLFLLHIGGVVALFLSTAREILLALERVTLASYVLATLERQNRHSTYAGVQYFLLGSLPSASLFLAFALFYLYSGALTLPDLDLLFTPVSAYNIFNGGGSSNVGAFSSFVTAGLATGGSSVEVSAALLASPEDLSSVLAFPLDAVLASISPLTSLTFRGLVLLLFNLLFKLTAAPFSFWAPAVYGKAPIAAVTVLALYSKRRVFYLLAKLAPIFFVPFAALLTPTLLVLAVLSLVIGRRGAFPETILKRFFVYTSRGHVGFRLAGLALLQLDGASAALHYLPVYAVTSRITWFILLTRGRQFAHLSQLATLRQGEPLLALLFSLLLFSRSGLPPLAGFFVKLEVLRALVNSGHSTVAYILLLGTVATFFYYLRAIKLLFFDRLPSDVVVSSHVSLPIRGDRPSHALRLSLRCGLSLLLLLYLFILQSPVLAVQAELISALLLFLSP